MSQVDQYNPDDKEHFDSDEVMNLGTNFTGEELFKGAIRFPLPGAGYVQLSCSGDDLKTFFDVYQKFKKVLADIKANKKPEECSEKYNGVMHYATETYGWIGLLIENQNLLEIAHRYIEIHKEFEKLTLKYIKEQTK